MLFFRGPWRHTCRKVRSEPPGRRIFGAPTFLLTPRFSSAQTLPIQPKEACSFRRVLCIAPCHIATAHPSTAIRKR